MMNLLKLLTSAALNMCDIKSRNRIFNFFIVTFLSGAYSVSCFAQQSSTAIPVPEYSTLDALGVNVSGNTVAPTVNTLSIGGEMGLSHSITVQGNIFNIASDEHGVRDKFAGDIRYTELGRKKLAGNTYPTDLVWVLNATAMGDSAQFIEMCNGKYTVDLPMNSCSPTYYEAVHDKRHTLTIKNDGQTPRVVWTKSDGTEVYFTSGSLSKATTGGFYKIVYPNGFTINVLSDITVRTNTGFQLKYNYVYDYRAVDSSKNNIAYYGYPVSQSWWQVNPKSITAINNAYEYCDINQQGPCTNLTKTWPTVTFDWPAGMPRTFFMGNSVFRVINPAGAVAEFNYQALEAKVGASEPANTNMAPLLISMKPFGASQPTISYNYTKPYRQSANGPYAVAGDPWILAGATGIVGTSAYSVGDLEGYHGKGYHGYRLAVDMNTDYPTILERIVADGGERTINFILNNMANLVDKDNYANAPSKQYTYINNNVQTVTDPATGVQEAGGYPASCTDTTRKTCNKPAWVKRNGNITNYTYHQASGQIETITLPADKNSKRAQTRYEYTALRANYLSASGLISGDPIYVKTAEKYCMNGNYNGTGDGNSVFNGACELGASDEVVTRYEYNPDKNLSVKGKTVTAVNTAGVQTVKRTCYQYDIYGNQIGETQPNANPASCN